MSEPARANQPRQIKEQSDPFLAVLAAAEYDDEPYTDEQRAAAQEGREAFRRGEFSTLEDVWRELAEDERSDDS
jgi:hypothetical protein